jgi:hypothetical protein
MNSVSEMIGRVKSYVWIMARRKVPVGQILPPWLLMVRAILFPLDTLFFTLGKGRGYQFQRDVWIIEGQVISGAALLNICRPGESRMVIIKKDINGDVFFSRHSDFINVFSETEVELRRFVQHAGGDLNAGVPRSVFSNGYFWKVMLAIDRNGPADQSLGPECLDDAVGFFYVGENGLVYLTEKAKCYIRISRVNPIW